MNGYESSPSTPPKNTSRPKEDKEHLCVFFSKVPRDVGRNQAVGEVIDRQELHRVNEEVALCSFEGYTMPTQP